MKIYCASDLHLGYERTNYDLISAFFDIVKREADSLILCGDTFDLWRYPVAKIEKATMPGFKDCLAQLKALAQDVPVHIIPGNHDYNLKKLWPKFEREYNILISNEFEHEGIFYTHGWKFDVQQRRYSWAYGWLVTQFPYLYQKYMKKPARMGMGRNDRISEEVFRINTEANTFARANKCKYVVMGHTHIPGIFGQAVNCGDFVDSCSYAIIENGKPTVEYL